MGMGLLKPSENRCERDFLHAMASPLAIALLHLEALLEQFDVSPEVEKGHLERLAKVQQALDKMKLLLKDRRELIASDGTQSS